ASAQANTSGNADTWNLTTNDSLTFGASGDLNVTTDGAGKIVYGLSSTFADKINNIETTANNANTTATAANNTANDAKTAADTANTAAAEAKDAADAANTTANTANTTANNAKTAADTALITADKANATANDANATANAANATANDANTTANAANATANDANATANTANATANDANATANTANATANDANATANTANNTANTAQAGVDTLNARKYTFNVKNGVNALTNDGKAQEWQLNADNSVTFGATSYLNVTTDAAGNIIYDLSESSKTALTAAGAGADGKDGSTGATGAASKGATAQDGLNGKDLTTKVNALRNGEAGPVVYTDAEGNRLVKANDGKYYPADEVDEKGEPLADAKAVDSPIASVVNPDGSTTKPTTMGNVKSTIGPNNGDTAITEDAAKKAVAGTDGQSGLLSKTGADLNNVATVGDLQAIAQAGLDFTGNNNGTTVHRALGSKLTVEGERDDNKTSYTEDESAKNNLIVEADNTNNKLVVKMAKELKNLKSIEASDSIKVGTDENGVSIKPEGTTTTKTVDGKTTTSTLGADGTHVVEKDAQGNPTKSADYTADGSTVKAVDPTTGEAKESTYGADGLSTKALDKDGNVTGETTVTPEGVNLYGKDGKDGQDAKPVASLTNTVDAEGKNNPSLAFAKDGEGDDAKGTGTITGLKDVERNPDGTAKDRTQAANTGYVDDRLEDMDAGKPFEYFTKDADGKDVKVVRGKDGKFYTEDELAGKTYDPATNGYKDADGKEVTPTVDSANVTIKAMPNTNEMALGNIKSTIGLNGKDATGADLGPITADAAKDAVAGADGQSGLLAKKGAELNNVATVGDLQAIAQAGLDFTGNNNETVHRPLGTKLTVVGERDDNKTSYTEDESAKNNLIVEADKANNTLTVKMAKELKNLKSIEASDSIKVGTDKNGVNITPNGTTTTATAADGTSVVSNLTANGTTIVEKDATGTPTGKEAAYTLDGSKVAVKDPATGETKETTMDADGTHATVKDAQGNPTKSADYTAEGSTVKAVDPTTGEAKESTYGADGLSTKALDKDGNVTGETTVTPEGVNLYGKDGKDGQDAKPVASLTNTVDAEGKNNPSLAFAKDGEGDDAKGTGTITGLKDVERNPDGTAKDRTQAANTGYVDDRLADMDAGKPFEYFTKDADGKDVKVVRGKDGKFYTEDELAGKTYDPATNSYKDADGKEVTPTVDSANVTIKAMPNTNEMALGNIKSTIGLNGKDATGADLGPITADAAKNAVAGADGKSGLLAKKGAELNNVATVGDLQAIAQAGLDFTGNNNTETTLHRTLGSKLVVEGETDKADVTKTTFGATAKDNIHVEAKVDGDTNKLIVSLAEDLKGINSVDFKPAEITNPDGTTTYAKANISSKGNTYTETDKDGKAVENGKTASYGLNGTKMEETDANGNKSVSTTTAKGTDIKETAKDGSEKTASYKVDGTDLKETAADGTEKAASYKVDGTTLEEVAADGTEKSAEYKVDGSKVTVVDPTTGETKETTMDADGTHATVKDKDG
ncbi:hypothetical protein, partial [Actinobacillus minor]|uniref:hypothetical protein n=1 Tax=Actinobacillus minor TaxID=51047 RepID=UPI0023F2ED1F